jgi:hypothetical protein
MSVRLSVCFTGIARTFCLIVVATRAAPGQWSEDFDSYPTGSAIVGQGSWTGWDQTAGIDADVSDDNASSAPNSLRLRTDSDMVHKLQGIQGGVWLLRAKVFIPSDHTGGSWFIVLNKYTAGGSGRLVEHRRVHEWPGGFRRRLEHSGVRLSPVDH